MIKIKRRKDAETFDFIITIINAYSNCDTWGECDIEEKQKQCDDALSFLYKNVKIDVEK